MLLTPSMPSTLVSRQNNIDFPPLSTLLDFGRGLEHYRWSPKDLKGTKSERDRGQPVEGPSTLSASYCPYDMNGVNGSSIPQSNLGSCQHHGGPIVGSNAPEFPTAQNKGSHSRPNSKAEPFYNSYYSARQRSPIVKKEPETSTQQTGQRRTSGDTNAIASYLQIPSSINNSKGSLPEFAAQVRSSQYKSLAFLTLQ